MVVFWIYSVCLLLCLTVCPCRSELTVKGSSGQNITLPCMYNWIYHGKCNICWMRGDIPLSGCGDEIIATDGDKVVRQTSQRYQLYGDLQKGDTSLTILDTTLKDSGKYGCRVDVPGWFNDKKVIVILTIVKGSSPPAEENTLSPSTPELITIDPLYTKPTDAVNTSLDSATRTVEAKIAGNDSRDDMLPGTVVSVLVILLVFGIATYLIWKKKRRTRESLERDQNSDNLAIYMNSGVRLGLDSRAMALENIYQLDIENVQENIQENVYEQWS